MNTKALQSRYNSKKNNFSFLSIVICYIPLTFIFLLSKDDDDEDDDDKDIEFSDSEMFKLDSVLASAFRSMSKSKKMDKQKTRQLLDFKIRYFLFLHNIFICFLC
jgi:hypothetical protein